MAKQFDALNHPHQDFIARQRIFFVGTAAPGGSVNVSPKGMDAFRVLDARRVAWLNVTGSGNETAAHVEQNGRMTVMFCAFEGPPMILRLYGQARAIHAGDPDWARWCALFPPLPGARQVFELHLDRVQSSCGMAVPRFDYAGEREDLNDWAVKKGESGVQDYWRDKNQTSIDGLPTHILEKSGKRTA